MNIEIHYGHESAKDAQGLAVTIDVFRAFSVACYAFNQGVEKIIPVADLKLAYKLKEQNPEYILVGERRGKKMPGFDFGNSPFEIKEHDFAGKTIIHTTSAGTQGIIGAKNADEIITGSFVNAAAIIKYIQKKNPKHLSLIATDERIEKPLNNEDVQFARYVKKVVQGEQVDFKTIKKEIKISPNNKDFFDIDRRYRPPEDFDLCTQLSKFNFVLRVNKTQKQIFLEKINI